MSLTVKASIEVQVQVGQIERMVDIGGGYGALARLILLTYPNIKYCIVDIPETLFFAELFLAHEFPNKQLVYVDDKTPKAVIDAADILNPISVIQERKDES